MSPKQLRKLVALILASLGKIYASDSAINLVMGTGAQESHLRYIRQIGGGPALGLFQMEPKTEKDIWDNYLKYHPELVTKIKEITGHDTYGPWLEWDIAYQIIMCRLHYYRIPEQLPEGGINSLGDYYKKYYNTIQGAASVTEFVSNYYKYAVGRS